MIKKILEKVKIDKFLNFTRRKKFKKGDKVIADERINSENLWIENEMLTITGTKRTSVKNGTSGQWVKTNKTANRWIDAYWFKHLNR